jgi:hypothetical protein
MISYVKTEANHFLARITILKWILVLLFFSIKQGGSRGEVTKETKTRIFINQLIYAVGYFLCRDWSLYLDAAIFHMKSAPRHYWQL